MIFSQNKTDYLLLFLLFVLAFYICFFQLGRAAFENWDEAWYADVIRNIIFRKEAIVLYWNKEIYFDKPPLYMWLGTLSSLIFRISEFSVRLPSAIAGFLLIILVVLLAYRWYGLLPAVFAFTSLALNNVFIWRTRSGNIDALLTFLIFISFLLILLRNKTKFFWLGAIFGLIYLTKLTIVFMPLMIFLVSEIIFEYKNILSNWWRFIILGAIFLLIGGGWLFLGAYKVGSYFYEYFIFKGDQGVAKVSLENFNWNYFIHTYYSLQRRFFWLFLLGIIFAFFSIKNKRNFLLLFFGTSLLIQLSFTKRDNNWYLLPAMPFWSLLIAFAVYRIKKLLNSNIFILTPMIIIALYISYKTFTINIQPIIASSGPLGQKQSGLWLARNTNPDDLIVRIDHLYPTTIYYSQRKVLATPFINQSELLRRVDDGSIRWLVGNNDELKLYITHNLSSKTIRYFKINNSESVAHLE